MKAAFLTGLREIKMGDAPDPRIIHPRDVLVRVESVGICGSDMHYYTTGRIGPLAVEFPLVMGHECGGTIVEVGDEVEDLAPGERVAIEPAVHCGKCEQCLRGRHHTCLDHKFLGCPGQLSGGLAEYLVMPAECCIPVPNSMTADQAALIEPLAIAVYTQRMAAAPDGSQIAILGCGPIGLSVLLAVRAAAECTAYCSEPIPERKAAALQCGAEWAGNPRETNIVAEIRKLVPQGLDFVFECAGQQESLDQAAELLKPGGTLVIVGIPEVDCISVPIHTYRRKELTIRNVRRQNHCVVPAIKLLASGKINMDQVVTHHFSLAETQAAFETVANYRDGVIKAMIRVTGDS
jgi:L-iditol 2-dehydrogenase